MIRTLRLQLGRRLAGVAESDRYEHIDHAERWYADVFRIAEVPGACMLIDVDMSSSRELVERLRREGIHATYTHLITRAAAIVLDSHPQIKQLVIGRRRWVPAAASIGISVAGEGNAAPVVVIEDVRRKTMRGLVDELAAGAERARALEAQQLEFLRRFGWILPFGRLRRLAVRAVFSRLRVRRTAIGVLQFSTGPAVDVTVPMVVNSTMILTVGRVSDRPVAIDGAVEVRPVASLAGALDHKVIDGVKAQHFLRDVAALLESADLAAALELEAELAG